MTLGSDWGQVQPGDRGMRPWRCVVLSAFDLVRGQFEDGAGGETRTPNRLFTRQVRYQLRHASGAAPAYRGPLRPARSSEHPGCADEDGRRPDQVGLLGCGDQGRLPASQSQLL